MLRTSSVLSQDESKGVKMITPIDQNSIHNKALHSYLQETSKDVKSHKMVKHRNFQRQSSSSSSGSKSTSGPQEDLITIEEVRTASDGTKSIHRYLRGKLLGKGGFAKVYWCTSVDTQKAYAVKIVPKANLVKSRARQKLQAEIKIHRTLKHRRICEFKHFFEDRNNCYILLDLCHNQTMNELIKRRKRLTEYEVMYFMQQLIEGVLHIHKGNVIHRDLKLGNLFLDRNMGIKIGDLGLAVKLSHAKDKRKTICGTPNYIAPEVIDCLKGGQRGHSFEVDVWAMGVIMYTTLIGKPPYEARDVKSTYQRILNNEYSFPEQFPVSQHAKDLIQGMLQSNPEERPNVDQVAQHSFFDYARNRLPDFLSSKVTRIAPIWREDEDGNLVTEFPEIGVENMPSRKLSTKTLQKPETRRALSSLDPNRQKVKATHSSQTKPLLPSGSRESNMRSNQSHVSKERVQHDTQKRDNRRDTCEPKLSQKKFEIFSDDQVARDDDGSRTSQPKRLPPPQKSEVMDDLVSKANRCEIGKQNSDIKFTIDEVKPFNGTGPEPAFNGDHCFPRVPSLETRTFSSLSSVAKGTVAPVSDMRKEAPQCVSRIGALSKMGDVVKNACGRTSDVLETMHNRLEQSFNLIDEERQHENTPRPAEKVKSPSIWVSRYVDYTSKYGLGFLLNDGSAGVYFNDSTKAVLAPAGDFFQYIERRKNNSNPRGGEHDSEPTVHIYSLTSFPEKLQKKVTLLKHFRTYLVDQQKKGSDSSTQPPTEEKTNETESSTNSVSPYVYLKKWVRTRHAILFRLSDFTVQVVFYDHTEVLLLSEARLVTYVDKTGSRKTYPIHEVTNDPSGEVGKRLKYAKDVLHQMINGSGNKR